MNLKTILLTICGSQAYGIATPESDLDFKGIAIPPKEYILGFSKNFEQLEDSKAILEMHPGLKNLPGANIKAEGMLYSLEKFMQLASECNPNILEILYANPAHYQVLTDEGKLLIENRELFLSARARHTFSGYALAQLKRIKSHKNYLLNPIEKEPMRKDFGLDQLPKLQKEMMDGALWLDQQGKDTGISPEVMEIIRREKAYKNRHREYEQYQNWKRTRNPERAALEARWGFDLKHAGHLVRLLRMGKEILTTGMVYVDRREAGDAEEILAIRHGAWAYDQVVEYAERMDAELSKIYDKKEYVVPHYPDINRIEEIYISMIEKFLQSESGCK